MLVNVVMKKLCGLEWMAAKHGADVLEDIAYS